MMMTGDLEVAAIAIACASFWGACIVWYMAFAYRRSLKEWEEYLQERENE